MKINYGHITAMVLSAFIITGIYLVQQTRKMNFDLVKRDYYIDDIQLDSLLTARKNAAAISGLSTQIRDQTLYLTIPMAEVKTALCTFNYVADAAYDTQLYLSLNNGNASLPLHNYKKGRWNLTMSFTTAQHNYVLEKSITL
jgi:hypothetical protein